MDFSPMLNQIYGTLWYLVPFFVIVTILKSAWFKGVFGEFIVNLSAKLFLDKEKYHLIKNVTLPTEDGSTQIDHVIVSRYGVFVVETKNMKGWIFGGPNQKHGLKRFISIQISFKTPSIKPISIQKHLNHYWG